jgi:hypothetical protein
VRLYLIRLHFLVCLIFASHLLMSQEPGKAKPPVPVAKSPEVVSKAGVVYVVGDVPKPMGVVIEAGGTMTVEALANAGGTNPVASLRHAKILRNGGNSGTEDRVDLAELVSGIAPDITMQADDILFVPAAMPKVPADKRISSTT